MSDAAASKGATAYAALREAILENALKPGTKLPEDSLGSHFGVSRTLVRSALARLAAEGLVDMGKAKSATVASPSRGDAADTFGVRRALERAAVEGLAQSWNPEVDMVLQRHVTAEREASDSRNHKLSVRLGAEFHILLAELTGNSLLRRYLSEVVSRCTLILTVHGQAHPQEDGLDEHLELLAFLRQGDVDRAIALMERHIRAVEKRALDGAAAQDLPLGDILRRYSGV